MVIMMGRNHRESENQVKSISNGGGDEIRTHGTDFAVHSLSRRAPSTTRPPLLRKHCTSSNFGPAAAGLKEVCGLFPQGTRPLLRTRKPVSIAAIRAKEKSGFCEAALNLKDLIKSWLICLRLLSVPCLRGKRSSSSLGSK